MSSTDLVTAEIDRPITDGEIDTIFRLAKGLSQSGFFSDAREAGEAFAKLVFGRDLGISATQAMTDIHIIEGKPEMSANLQAAKVRSSDRYEYRIVTLTDERCEIAFTMDGEDLHPTSVFTIEDAKRAGLVRKTRSGQPGTWEKYPRNLLFARTMSNGVAFHCPDVTNGIRVYAEGEVERAITTAEQRPGAAPEPAESAELEPSDGAVAEALLGDQERAELVSECAQAGIDIRLLLTAVGAGSIDTLTIEQGARLKQKLADHLATAEGPDV